MTTLQIPSRFHKAELKQLDPEHFGMVLEYAKSMKAMIGEGRGLLIAGPPGIGKTWALAALTKRYVSRAFVPSYVFETAYSLLERYAPIVATAETHDSLRNQPWTKTYEDAQWLVLNDLGKDYRGGKMAEQVAYKVGRLIRSRAERGLVTHITTNLPLVGDAHVRTFVKVYGDSVWSLTSETMNRYEVIAPDRRGT